MRLASAQLAAGARPAVGPPRPGAVSSREGRTGVRRRVPCRMHTAERARAIRGGALAVRLVASRSAGSRLVEGRKRPWGQGGDEVRPWAWMAS
jgi:hypothetical protein